MDLTTALIIVGIGLLLLLVEVFLIPGAGIPGIIGLVLMVTGIVLAYYESTTYGTITLVSTGAVTALLLFKFLRADTWKSITISSNITSKANSDEYDIKEGDTGIAITRINPSGKARINNVYLEVVARNSFIDDHDDVRVVSVEGRKVYVESQNSKS
ncbi:NfeD family protein [Salibacter sp.]|uniref:NfeD family protein n=1 Tax=Salibacter sp. TaxID=2010995 RepID=UPI002870AD66|nr:NfeD family protein [Salibacter sp.]MDR9486554.1 NfeD family protein [Salibacter sp.]